MTRFPEDLADPKYNPLIPGADEDKPNPEDLTRPENNPLIPPLSWMPSRSNRASAALVEEVLAAFTAVELEIPMGTIKVVRMAGGNVNLVKDGRSMPIEDASPEDLARVRAALK